MHVCISCRSVFSSSGVTQHHTGGPEVFQYNDSRCFFGAPLLSSFPLSLHISFSSFFHLCSSSLPSLSVCVLPAGGNVSRHGYEQHLATLPRGCASACVSVCVRVCNWADSVGSGPLPPLSPSLSLCQSCSIFFSQ